MPVTVNLFNADDLAVNVNVNNSTTVLQIPAAGPPSWLPGVPATNPGFVGGLPTPGNFGIGSNSVMLTPVDASSMFVANIVLPATVNWVAIQVYIFFQSYTTCSWLVLNAGQQISQASTLSEAILRRPPLAPLSPSQPKRGR